MNGKLERTVREYRFAGAVRPSRPEHTYPSESSLGTTTREEIAEAGGTTVRWTFEPRDQ